MTSIKTSTTTCAKIIDGWLFEPISNEKGDKFLRPICIRESPDDPKPDANGIVIFTIPGAHPEKSTVQIIKAWRLKNSSLMRDCAITE